MNGMNVNSANNVLHYHNENVKNMITNTCLVKHSVPFQHYDITLSVHCDRLSRRYIHSKPRVCLPLGFFILKLEYENHADGLYKFPIHKALTY